MKNCYFILLLTLGTSWQVTAQDRLTVGNATTFTVTAGTLTLTDSDLDNQGTVNVATGATLVLTGSGNGNVELVNAGTFGLGNLTVARANGGVRLNGNIEVNDTLTFAGGTLDLNGSDLALAEDRGALKGENASSYAFGASGRLLTVATLDEPAGANPGGLGLLFDSSDDLGRVTVERTHARGTADGLVSIQRRYRIVTTETDVTTDLTMSYLDHELNGLGESALDVARTDGPDWLFDIPSSAEASRNLVALNDVPFTDDTLTLVSSGLRADVRVLLEGTYDGRGEMSAAIASLNILPSTETYSRISRLYGRGGGETLREGVRGQTGDDAIIDWIVVDLRSGSAPTQVLSSRVGLLLADGRIVDVDGSSKLSFRDVPAGDYYVSVRHRNHVPLRSAEAHGWAPGTTTSIDFTLDQAEALGGTNAFTDPGDGFYLMIGGDADGNGQVQSRDIWIAFDRVGRRGYLRADVDLDGEVRQDELLNLTRTNQGRGRQHD